MAGLRALVEFINIFFYIYMTGYAVFLFLSAAGGAVSMYQKAKKSRFRKRLYLNQTENFLPVSLLVPAYNEGMTILDAVQSLRKLDYGEYEIIVINDGSTDNTAAKLIKHFKLKRVERPIRRQLKTEPIDSIWESADSDVPITLVNKKNGGKADALNTGINVSRYGYFMSMDADSVLQKDALKKLMENFIEDRTVIACGGMIQIANQATIVNGEITGNYFPRKFLVLLQMLEYCRSFLGSKIFFDSFGGNLIISGACGLFKKNVVVQVGGYDSSVIGEDMELVVKLHHFCKSNRIPYRITNEAMAICWTQVPETLTDLKKQRRRWYMGMLQSIRLHSSIIFNGDYGLISFISMTYYLIMESIGPLIEVVGFVNIFLAMKLEMINIDFMIYYYFLFLLFSAAITMITFFTRIYLLSFRVTFIQICKVVIGALIEGLGFRQLLTLFRLSAFINYSKNKNDWGKITRKHHYQE